MNNVLVCIPARYASSRLPGKPLLKINNKSILEHVYLNALKIKDIHNDNIIILTDNNKISQLLMSFFNILKNDLPIEPVEPKSAIFFFILT